MSVVALCPSSPHPSSGLIHGTDGTETRRTGPKVTRRGFGGIQANQRLANKNGTDGTDGTENPTYTCARVRLGVRGRVAVNAYPEISVPSVPSVPLPPIRCCDFKHLAIQTSDEFQSRNFVFSPVGPV